MPTTPQPRPTILSIEPYVGGESKLPGANRIVKLSSNEGAFGVPPGARAAMAEAAAEMHRYPDGGATALREAIGRRFGLDPARVVCGNGSDELIAHLILSYGGEGTELVMSAHGFVMYDITGRYAGCRVIKVPERDLQPDVNAMLAAVGPRTRLVFLANPNNPTGSMLPASEVERLRAEPGSVGDVGRRGGGAGHAGLRRTAVDSPTSSSILGGPRLRAGAGCAPPRSSRRPRRARRPG